MISLDQTYPISDPYNNFLCSHILPISIPHSCPNPNSFLIPILALTLILTSPCAGGSTRSNPVNKPLVLDASLSKDSDVAPQSTSSGLAFAWTCTIGSINGYGTDCGFALSSTDAITLPANILTVGFIYNFLVTVTPAPADGRVASASVAVTPVISGSVQVSIISAFTNFNPASTLAVYGNILADFAVNASWTVLGESGPLTALASTALTPTSQVFTAAEVRAQITFPLSVVGGTFVQGRSYTFILRANPVGVLDPKYLTSAQVVFTANRPPTR